MRRFLELSAPRRKLVRTMQEVNFDRITKIVVCEHEPHFDAAMHCPKVLKPGGDNDARPEATLSDFALKRPVMDLLGVFDALPDMEITTLTVQNGLPIGFFVALNSRKSSKGFATSSAKPVVKR